MTGAEPSPTSVPSNGKEYAAILIPELLTQILEWLPKQDLLLTASVSRYWNNIHNDVLWSTQEVSYTTLEWEIFTSVSECT